MKRIESLVQSAPVGESHPGSVNCGYYDPWSRASCSSDNLIGLIKWPGGPECTEQVDDTTDLDEQVHFGQDESQGLEGSIAVGLGKHVHLEQSESQALEGLLAAFALSDLCDEIEKAFSAKVSTKLTHYKGKMGPVYRPSA